MEEEKVEETSSGGGVIENSTTRSCSESDIEEETSARGVVENAERSCSESEIEEEETSSGGGVIEDSIRSYCSESENVEETSAIRKCAESEIVDETSSGEAMENSTGSCSDSEIAEEISSTRAVEGSVESCAESEIAEEMSSTRAIEGSVQSWSESETGEEMSSTRAIGGSVRSCAESDSISTTRAIGGSMRSCAESEMQNSISTRAIGNSIRGCAESERQNSVRSCPEFGKVEKTSPTGVIESSVRSCPEFGKVEETSSPRGVIENCAESEADSCSKASTNSSDSDSQSNSGRRSHWRGMLLSFLKSRSIRRLGSLPPLRSASSKVTKSNRRIFSENVELSTFKSSWRNFTLSELQVATKNFSSDMLLGQGGYAEVYKGCLPDGQLVAIKKLTRGAQEERTADFLSEIGVIVHVNHPNTAKLIGYGVEGGLHLVLELSPHGSLASLLHGSNNVLDWGIRYKVALGTGEGLLYLHETCQRRIIHRDIKAANILLTENFEPQITDFGLSKWLPDQWSHHTVPKFEGTFGYVAPEYVMHGIVDEKTDVFAFGVLLLELITGRRALEKAEQSLVIWAKPLLDKNRIRELVDPSLGDAYDQQQMNHLASTAALCIQQSSILRPRMRQVVRLLKGNETGSDLCQGPVLRRTHSEEIFEVEEYSTRRYLKDLNRHKQIALEC